MSEILGLLEHLFLKCHNKVFFKCLFIYFERESEGVEEEQKERERASQEGPALSAQSQTWGSIS